MKPPMNRIQVYALGTTMRRPAAWVCAFLASVLITVPAYSAAQSQTAVVDDSVHPYINSEGGGAPGGGGGIDGDGPPPLQPASMSATFSNFSLNGISFADWKGCRDSGTPVDECLTLLIGDRDGDGTTGLRDLHPGGIGGDTLAFDVTITNTSPAAVLTTFAFQSKFSESPALGSRIGDKLFSAQRFGDVIHDGTVANPLVGVKKNGTTNGLFGGKIKGICINSSTDYPSSLNLGVENETLECAGGRKFDLDSNRPVLEAPDGTIITDSNIKLPKGLLPDESMSMRLVLDAGTDDGALQRAYAASCDDLTGDAQTACKAAIGPLVGTLANVGQPRDPDKAAECLELNVQMTDHVLEVVNFGDVKIIRNAAGECVPSFEPFSKNQFLTVPRRNWAFTDILDTRDDYLPGELPTVLTDASGQFSFLDFGQLRPSEMNFFEILRGFGESGETLDPSCQAGGSREGSCGGSPYVPWGEFYGIANGRLIHQEVVGSYAPANYTDPAAPRLTASIGTGSQTSCRGPNLAVKCKTTDPFETPGEPNPGSAIGASAKATFSDVVVISDDKTTIANEGGQAGGDKVQVTLTITNTSAPGSNVYLTSFNFQTKRRGLTDINALDGTSILGRQDLRLGAEGTLRACTAGDPFDAQCYDPALGIGRFPNVIGNSLLSATALSGLEPGKLEAIKKNGTFQPLMKTDLSAANFICIKSGAPTEDQDADETCSGTATDGSGNPLGLAPDESQSVRLELDYGDFRGLILRVSPGTLKDYVSPGDNPFGLLALRGDFDCRDQRRLPYCHPDLIGLGDWFTSPTTLADAEFVTVHQPGDAATVMNFTQNFGKILAMAGFIPTAEFYRGTSQVQVGGAYVDLPGATNDTLSVAISGPAEGSTVSGTVQITANVVGTVIVDQVEFFVNGASIGLDTDGANGWSIAWNTTLGPDGSYQLTAVAQGGGLTATSAVRTVTVANALTVQIVEPAANATVAGTTNLVAHTIGLSPATGVSFSYSGSTDPIGSAAQTSPGVWELAWDTSTITPGDYQLTATATNGAETATHTIAVEIVALKVTIVAPDDGAILFGNVDLRAEVVSATPIDSVEFFYRASGAAAATSIGTATLDMGSGLWGLNWDTRTVTDTPLTKPKTQDEVSVVVTAGTNTAGDAIDVRIGNMLTARIFLPDNQEDLRGFEDLEALLAGEFAVASVRFDLYDIADIDPEILIPFGEASESGEPIEDRKYGRPLGNPEWPKNSPVFEIGAATPEGALRWVFRNWDTTAVPDGTYGLVATAFDSEGRKATYMIETYIVNDLRVVITAPDDGADVSRFVALETRTSSLTGADNGAPGSLWPATSVIFSVASTNIPATETPSGSGRWRAVWNTDSLAPGSYAITATATNTNPDGPEIAVDSVTVNLVAPSAELKAFFPFDWGNCWLYECAFLDGSSGGPTSWLWNFGDGNTSTDQLPTHTYATWGVYTVSLTVSNGTTSDTYSRVIPVGNTATVGFNVNPINDAATEFIDWTSSFKNFNYTVGETLAIPAMWKTTAGTSAFAALPENVLFTPEEADGTVPTLVGPAQGGVLFTMEFTEVQFRGDTGIFKGKVNLRVSVDVDLDDNGSVDWQSQLGTNVDVTNSGFEGGDGIVSITSPDFGSEVSGTVPITAATVSTVTATQVEFFVDGVSIGVDSNGSDGWSMFWDTTGYSNSTHGLSVVASGAGFITTSAVRPVVVNNSGTPLPTVTLTADPLSVASGGSSMLTWSSTDATSCEASGGWTGSKGVSGSESTGPLTASTTYTLSCTGPGGTALSSVTVTVEPLPTVTLTANPLTISSGSSSTLNWSSTNATSCEASGGWSGPRGTSGSESTGALSVTTTYTLSCTGPGGTAEASVTVTVEPVSTVPTFSGSSTNQGSTWSAIVTVTGGPANTLISGTWSIGGNSNSCTTNGSGSCTITRSGIPKRTGSATWTYTATGQKVTIAKP